MSEMFPFFQAEGSHRELGVQHGKQAKEQIRGFLDYLAGVLKLSRDELRARAMRFLPLFEQTCPHLLEELNGLAEGADIPLADAIVSQLRGELGQLSDGACTSFVIGPQGTANGELLIGQTSDNPPELGEFSYVLRLKPEDKPELLIWTFGGMIGYHGLNRKGVAHFANSLAGGPDWKFAIAHYPLKRMILEQDHLDDVVQLMRDVPVCSNGNYVLCDGDNHLLDVELTSDGPELISDNGARYIAHANHYLCNAYGCEENTQKSVPDSRSRQARIDQLIRDNFGSITVDAMKTFLSDHENHPVSICRHPNDAPSHEMLDNNGRTVAALIAEPAQRRLHIAAGNPCEVPYTTYEMS